MNSMMKLKGRTLPLFLRKLSDRPKPPSMASWRKQQLEEISNKFKKALPPTSVEGNTPTASSNSSATPHWSYKPTPPPPDNLPTSDVVDPNFVEVDDEGNPLKVQSMWTSMESRVTKRRLPAKLVPGASSRSNIKKSEEDHWLQSGVYDDFVNSQK
jgi:hypothetical protein